MDCCATKIFYIKANNDADEWGKLANLINARYMPFVIMLPKFILSYFNYFTTDLGNDAFELTFPSWYRNHIIFIYSKIKNQNVKNMSFALKVSV